MKRETAKKILVIYSLFVIFVSILPVKEPHIKEYTLDKIIHFFIELMYPLLEKKGCLME